jgi:diguanylate cyclase (GGDEF)-like protein
LQDALAEPDSRRQGVFVVAIKIDTLRRINHLHGYAIGDEVLKIIAERLLAEAGSRAAPGGGAAGFGQAFIARIGAGEFGLICVPPATPGNLAERLLRTVQTPIAIGARSLWLGASVGYVAMSGAQADPDDVLRDLDLALRQARAAGSGKVVGWAQSLTKTAARYDTLVEQLQQAFVNGEFLLHYQPILRLDDNSLIGAETLLRWNHPSEGLIPSAAFLPVLEETGLIGEVGCWVIRETVRQVGTWRTIYGRNIVEWLGINLSARQLDDPAPLLATLRSIHAARFPVHRLKLEIAETVLMRRPDAIHAVVAELQGLGIGFAIDDFGTGVTSLDSLRRRPVDTVKIDRAFVAQIGTPDGETLLRSLLEIAEMSGAAVIAEGVELPTQRDFLRQSGCGFGQGYLLGEPMDGALLGVFALTHAVQTDGVQSDIKKSLTERLIRRGA